MTNAEHYTYRVRWSTEDAAFIGTVAEMPSLSWAADSQMDAFADIRFLVADVLDDMLENGETPPEAIVDRSYSGKFMVRVTPEAHRQLALSAAGRLVRT